MASCYGRDSRESNPQFELNPRTRYVRKVNRRLKSEKMSLVHNYGSRVGIIGFTPVSI
jgi:hypothetical protein